MKFVLISRHTGGKQPRPDQADQLMQDLGAWLGLMTNPVAIPIRTGKSVTASKVEDYGGEVGGVIIFEAESAEDAERLASKSPGLKFGWTHDVFPEISLNDAAHA